MHAGEGEPRAYQNRERGRDQAGFPSAIPGADHNGHSKNDKTALENVRKKQSRDEGERRAEHCHEVAQRRSTGRRDETSSQAGEAYSHMSYPDSICCGGVAPVTAGQEANAGWKITGWPLAVRTLRPLGKGIG